jgi:hypothetical protein
MHITNETMPSQARLRQLFDYDPGTGVLTRRAFRSPNASVGKAVGSNLRNGYLNVQIDGRKYRVHRVIWVWVYGVVPDGDIDHVNCRRDDNRLTNLRLATRSQNNANTAPRKKRLANSGFKGVYFDKSRGKWEARINGIHLGRYATKDEAIAIRVAAARDLHKEFVRFDP